jgi:hypothetical protein
VDAFPVAASVSRTIDAALAVRAERVAERRDIHEIGIARMDAHLADVARVGQAAMRPRASRVGRAIHTVAV